MLIETNDKTNILYYFDQNHNFDVSDLNDYDENFIIEMNQGTLTKIDIHCYGTVHPYNKFKSLSVPPPVGEKQSEFI